MNARNLLYIERFNTRADKRFADDKIYTKNFLSSRGIGVAKIHTVIRSYQALKQFPPASLPESFVIKPNHGFGGEGIIIIAERQGDVFLGIHGERWRWRDLFRACIAILDGKYAISGLRDEIIIEERLIAHEYFRPYIPAGLPDIRIIVFNLVPIVAMLRLPTAESQGKANLHLGAVGLGIDLGTGKTTYGVQRGRFIHRLPNGDRANSLILPAWKEILTTAAQCQKVSEIGYLAVDCALTTKGVKVLELNARAGLSVQIANRVFLKSRLEKVADLKVIDPKQGVEIAQTLFATSRLRTEQKIDRTRVIGLYEEVLLHNVVPERVMAQIDPHAKTIVVDERITLPPEEVTLSLHLRGEKIVGPFARAALPRDYRIVIPGTLLKGFLIDLAAPAPRPRAMPAAAHATPDEKIIANIDKKLFAIGRQIHFLAHLKPEHIEEMRALFLAHPTASPVFTYPPLDVDTEGLKKELSKLPREVTHPLATLFHEKKEELYIRLSLIAHRGTADIMPYSIQLYGDVTKEEFERARQWIRAQPREEDTSRELSAKELSKAIRAYLTAHHLKHWKIVEQENAAVDIQVNKSGTLLLRSRARMTVHRLAAVLAHEIDTHIFRQENGRAQPYRILEQGTAHYLETEEGLALLNQEMTGVPLGEKRFWAAWRTLALWHGKQMGFAELFHCMKEEYGLSDESAWHTCLKVKRGLTDTSAPAVFTKDRVYFSGYHRLRAYYRARGTAGIRRLYLGKIKLEDLPLLASFDDTRITHLPSWCLTPSAPAVAPQDETKK